MVEAAGFAAGFWRKRRVKPVRTRSFQQVERADEVGVDECARAFDRVVDVAFGSEMDDAGKAVFVKQTAD